MDKWPKEIEKLASKINAGGGQLYLVGGAVRDILMGREVKDWDFTTNLEPQQILSIFPKNSFYNNIYGMVGVVLGDKTVFEVTTFRTDYGYSDSRHPDVVNWGKTIEEDLARRDFTINAMAYRLTVNSYELRVDREKVIDLYGGIGDLDNKIVRAVGEADKRFGEDALRMLRAIRIASELGFVIEEKTFDSIVRNALNLGNVSGERIKTEFWRILLSPTPVDAVKLLKNSGLLEVFIPELMLAVGVKQKGHHIDDVWNHLLKTLAGCQSQHPITRLACLLHDVAKPMVMKGEGEARTFHNHEVVGARVAMKVAERLKLSKVEREMLFRLVRWHMFTASELQTDRAVRRIIRNVTPEYLQELVAMRRADRVGSGAKETSWRWELLKKRFDEVQKQPFGVKDLKVDGHDVMKILKIKPGRRVGEILDKLFAQVEEDPKLNEREILVEKIKKMI